MIKVALTNLGKYNEGELVYKWLELPCTDEEFRDALKDIGIDGKRYEEYFISDYETDIEGLRIGEYTDIEELNNAANEYELLSDSEQDKVKAIIEAEGIYSLREVLDSVDDYELIPDVDSDYDLGYYYVHEVGCYDLKAIGDLANYIDYESYGWDCRLDGGGSYTSYGYLYNG